MKKILCFLVLLVNLISSEWLIEDLVSPFSGQVVLTTPSFTAKAAQDINCASYYSPPRVLENYPDSIDPEIDLYFALSKDRNWGWKLLQYATAQKIGDNVFLIKDTSGALLEFVKTNGKWKLSQTLGICNAIDDCPGGIYDIRNTQILSENYILEVLFPQGIVRSYKYLYSKGLYLLEKETLPNGKIIKYFLWIYSVTNGFSMEPGISFAGHPEEHLVFAGRANPVKGIIRPIKRMPDTMCPIRAHGDIFHSIVSKSTDKPPGVAWHIRLHG